MSYLKTEDGYFPFKNESEQGNELRLYLSNRNGKELLPVISTIDTDNKQIRVYLDKPTQDPYDHPSHKVAKVLKVVHVVDDEEHDIHSLYLPRALSKHINVLDPDAIENPEVTLMKGNDGWYFASCHARHWPFRVEHMGPEFRLKVGFPSENTQVRLDYGYDITTRDHKNRKLCIGFSSGQIDYIYLWGKEDEKLTKVHIPGDSDLWKFLYIDGRGSEE